MAKLTRVTAKVFGGSAGSTQVGVFGSLAAGSPTFTNSPSAVQSLSNWALGWFGGVLGGNSPAIEDLNGFCFVDSYQIAYMLQAGIPEYDASTTYYQYSVTQNNGIIFQSTGTAAVLGSTPVSGSTWAPLPGPAKYSISASSGNFTTSVGSFVAVTNLTGSIVSTGRPINIKFQPDGSATPAIIGVTTSGSTGTFGQFKIVRDGGSAIWVSQVVTNTSNSNIPPGALNVTDFNASAGSHSYSLLVENQGGSSGIVFCQQVVMIVEQD